jgi:hypothetical protein
MKKRRIQGILVAQMRFNIEKKSILEYSNCGEF